MIKNITQAVVFVTMMGVGSVVSADQCEGRFPIPAAPDFAKMQAQQAEWIKQAEAQRAAMQKQAEAFHQQMAAQMAQPQALPVAYTPAFTPAFPEMPKDMQEYHAKIEAQMKAQQAEMEAYHAKMQQQMQEMQAAAPMAPPAMPEMPEMPAMPEMPKMSEMTPPAFEAPAAFADSEKFHQQRLEERKQRQAERDAQIKARRAEFEKMQQERQAARTAHCAA